MSADSVPEKKMIFLKSCQGHLFPIEEKAAIQSQVIKHMIEDGFTADTIPLPIITSPILNKVVAYCNRHCREPDNSSSDGALQRTDNLEDLKAFDDEFVKVDREILFNLIAAANYLDIKGMQELTCQRVADMITNATPEHIRAIFGIENDFTAEEEGAIRTEYTLAFN